jgi:acetyl esterase/lipase
MRCLNTFTLKIEEMKVVLLLFALLTFHYFSFAQERVIPLYKGTMPGSKRIPEDYIETRDSSGFITKISTPDLTTFLPEKANGTAVIIAPSGGYEVWVDEGEDIALAFNRIGITAFVLKYRLPSDEIMIDKSVGPLQDAQMAMMILRTHATEWKINSDKIGFVGISAGGHLASSAGTHFENPVIENRANINLRPDFMILLYPVISFDSKLMSRTRTNLLNATPSAQQEDFFSNEKQVTTHTPPTWLIHAADDKRVSVKHSLLFYNALLQAGVKAEMHILQSGGHGFALEHDTRQDKWMEWCADWLRENNFINSGDHYERQ